jgi:hypothetical protein
MSKLDVKQHDFKFRYPFALLNILDWGCPCKSRPGSAAPKRRPGKKAAPRKTKARAAFA